MIKINVGLTGATGTLGKASIPILLGVDNIALKIIIRPSKKNIRFARRLKAKYKNNIPTALFVGILFLKVFKYKKVR